MKEAEMFVYCAYCQKFIKKVICLTKSTDNLISHGICNSCYQKEMKKLEEVESEKVKETGSLPEVS